MSTLKMDAKLLLGQFEIQEVAGKVFGFVANRRNPCCVIRQKKQEPSAAVSNHSRAGA